MTLPYEPRLNPPDESPEVMLEHQVEARKLLSFMFSNACQHAIQAISMLSSDDNLPDEDMTLAFVKTQRRVIEKAIQDIWPLAETWATVSSEQLYWARVLAGEAK